MISNITDPRLFFYEAIDGALNRLHLKVEQIVEHYLVELLTRQVIEPTTTDPLVLQLGAALNEESKQARFLKFKEMGDSALFLLGFYEESVERRGITRHYVVNMGGDAYLRASHLSLDGRSPVYVTLAEGFDDFVQVLDEVKENTSLRTPQNIIRLYEKWKRTGAQSASQRLHEEGLYFIKSEVEDG